MFDPRLINLLKFRKRKLKWKVNKNDPIREELDAILQDLTDMYDALSSSTGALRFSVETSITASTTQSQAGGYALTKGYSHITVCANAGDAVTFPAMLEGDMYIIQNSAVLAANVYPAVGEDIGNGANAYVAVGGGQGLIFVAHADGTANPVSIL